MEADLTGVVLDGRYRVIEPISEGAMGVVYRAERVKLGRIVAVKVMHDQLPAELSSRKRFETEATAMAKLEHPHCAAVIDVGVHEDKPFVVMDYVSGETLRDLVARGPLPVPRAVEITRQVLSGLAHAHELGIIHRDIKPANIIVSQKAGLGDHVKILDFGLARIADAPKVTTGIVVGTPAYMAPEQIRGVAIDHRADLYACGVLLFELVTGRKPFVSATDDPIEVCTMHLKDPAPTLAAMQPGIDLAVLEPIVARALAKQPADRYASAVELAAALDEAVPRRASQPVIPVPTVATESGWSVAPEIPSGPTVPTAAPSAPIATPATPPPIAAPPVATPVAPPVAPPVVAPRATKQPPAPFASRSKPPTVRPAFDPQPALASAAAVVESIAPATQPTPVPGLAPDFDLSMVIPSPPATPEPTSVAAQTTIGLASAPVIPATQQTTLGLGTVPPAPVTSPAREPSRVVDHDATAMFAGAPPAGPSPLATPDIPAVAEPVTLPPPPRYVTVTRRHAQIVGIALGVLVVTSIIVGTCRGGKQAATSAPADAMSSTSTPPPAPVEGDAYDRASALAAAGKPREAIAALVTAREQAPRDARLAYLLGSLYFETRQGSLGLKLFRETLALDGTYRADPDLIKTVLAAFNSAPEYPAELGAFLREDIGPPARQYLQETAAKHPSAKVRSRAKAELAKLP